MSRYSLDEENQRIYGARAKAFGEKAEQFGKVAKAFKKPDKNVAETIEKSGGSGIIEVESEVMYRKKNPDKIKPMPKKQFHKIEKAFKRQGGIMQYSEETDAYLDSKHAEAITYDAKTILLKTNPGRASVFEELIHTYQYRTGKNDGSYVSRLKCEIEAQKKLIQHSRAYQLTDKEIEQTKVALEAYESELAAYISKGGN